MKLFQAIFLLGYLTLSNADYSNPHWATGHSVIVHLFEWKWSDIAAECERFLAPNGFGGVQISPPSENTIVHLDWLGGRTWWERYQPISYKLITRSGNEAAFSDMTRRCNAVGVRIYADIIINHMSATTGAGTGGSYADVENLDYPDVPFGPEHFNKNCSIAWNSAISIRDCWLIGLPDLDQSNAHVQNKIADFMNHLIDLGVAGFRVDAMKHMWMHDLEVIWAKLKNLNTNYGFAANSRPFVVGEVIPADGIHGNDYIHLGMVTLFDPSRVLGQHFRGHSNLNQLKDYGEGWFGIKSENALVFVDNHDNQREGPPLTNYKEPRIWQSATAFNIAFDYGTPRVMSSFAFTQRDQGPPEDSNGNLLSPTFDANGQCNNGYVCEHRWTSVAGMVGFKSAVKGTQVENWWDNGWNKIAFSRGNRGFVALNVQDDDFNELIYTGLAAGVYCDVASGRKIGSSCTGRSYTVGSDGYAQFSLPRSADVGFLAIHVNAKL